MSDDTHGVPSTQVLRAEIKALKEVCESGFEQVYKRLDMHAADTKELTQKVHALELFKAQEEARDERSKIADMSKELEDLKQWRWKIMGFSTLGGALLGGGGTEILKALLHALSGQ